MPRLLGCASVVALITALALAPSAHGQAELGCFNQFSRSQFPYCRLLEHDIALHWKVEYGQITFGLALAGKYRFVALGISDSGGMLGADIAAMTKEESVTAGSRWRIGDYWSTDFARPVLDDVQDWTLVDFQQTDLVTSLTVSRPLDTCDRLQDIQIYNDTDQTIIWAYGDTFQYHGPQRGSTTLRLNPANYNATLNATGNATANGTLSWWNRNNVTGFTYRQALMAQDPDDLDGETVSQNQLRVPSNTTSYMCINQGLLVDESQPYHIIRYGGFNTTAIVHHMILYACTAPPKASKPYTCWTMPPECSTPIAFWAPGVPSNFSLPPEAGLRVGAGGALYVALQIHYNNPTAAKGLVDSSGFKIYYTKQLRPNDMGVLMLGSYDINIPAGSSNFSIPPNTCPGSCTARLPTNLTLTYSFFHMHLAGQNITTRHVRDGREIQPLGAKRYWSLEFQSYTQVLPESRTLAPGDTLITQCTYDTSTRAYNTSWGFSSQDEMCFNFLHYYPALPGFQNCIQDPGAPFASCPLPTTYAPNSTDLLDYSQAVKLALLGAAADAAARALPTSAPQAAALGALRNTTAAVSALPTAAAWAALLAADPTGLAAAVSSVDVDRLTDAVAYAAVDGGDVDFLTTNIIHSAVVAAVNASAAIMTPPGGSLMWGVVPLTWGGPSGRPSFASALNVSGAVVGALPLARLSSADTNFTAYVAPCTKQVAPQAPTYRTGPAAASIIVSTFVLLLFGGYLYYQYARKEDPERQQLLAALEETIVQVAANNPGLDEAELTRQLEEVARRKLAEAAAADEAMGDWVGAGVASAGSGGLPRAGSGSVSAGAASGFGGSSGYGPTGASSGFRGSGSGAGAGHDGPAAPAAP